MSSWDIVAGWTPISNKEELEKKLGSGNSGARDKESPGQSDCTGTSRHASHLFLPYSIRSFDAVLGNDAIDYRAEKIGLNVVFVFHSFLFS